MSKGYIYSLIDPRTKEIRYIGSTTTPKARLTQHLSESNNIKKFNWIQSLLSENLKPILNIIECVNVSNLIEREQYWTNYYKELSSLFNSVVPGTTEKIEPITGFSEMTLNQIIIKILTHRLDMYKGNKTKTAKSLGVSVRWIQLKLKEHNN